MNRRFGIWVGVQAAAVIAGVWFGLWAFRAITG